MTVRFVAPWVAGNGVLTQRGFAGWRPIPAAVKWGTQHRERTMREFGLVADWAEAGRGWGARAEWAYLFEPYARPANELLFDRLGIGGGVRLIDIACGSGFAAHLAAEGLQVWAWTQRRRW